MLENFLKSLTIQLTINCMLVSVKIIRWLVPYKIASSKPILTWLSYQQFICVFLENAVSKLCSVGKEAVLIS